MLVLNISKRLVTTFILFTATWLYGAEPNDTSLVIDVGNSSISFGVYEGRSQQCTFRCPSPGVDTPVLTAFIEAQLKAHNVPPQSIHRIGVTSVVPSVNPCLETASKTLFKKSSYFLTAANQNKIKILYGKPAEVGSDLIAGAIAAVERYPGKNCIVVDIGTATTVCAITKNREFLGAVIFPGPRMSVQALARGTALLDAVPIQKPDAILAGSTEGCIQAGIYYGQLATIDAVAKKITEQHFPGDPPIILATGGFAPLFDSEHTFTHIIPDLNLLGLLCVMEG